MTQYQISVDDDIVGGLFTRDDAMKQLVEQVVQQILEGQVRDHLQAEPFERTDERQGYRNGYKPRSLVTRVGTLELRVPQVRDGSFSTDLFSRFQRSEQAFILALLEMTINGVSTRKVTHITQELCGTEVSKSTVSALCSRLDPLVQDWNERDLSGTVYPFLLVDALILKIREEGRVLPRAMLLATAINADGQREILGIQMGDSESEQSWGAFFGWLKKRGIQGVDLVTSDNHGGLVKAVKTHFQSAAWQRCQAHFTRNIIDATPKAYQKEMAASLRALFSAADEQAGQFQLERLLTAFEERAPKAVSILENGYHDATAVLALPVAYRTKLRTTNSVERLNEEIRRRERVIRIFPSRASALRLLGAVLMEIEEGWTTGKRSLPMNEYWLWKKQHSSQPEKGGLLAILDRETQAVAS
jgi:transposase-like protein